MALRGVTSLRSLLAGFFLVSSLGSAWGAGLRVVPSADEVPLGGSFFVDVVAENIPAQGLAGVQFRLAMTAPGATVVGVTDLGQGGEADIAVASPLVNGAPTVSQSGIGEFFRSGQGGNGILLIDNQAMRNGSGLYTFAHTSGATLPSGSGSVARFAVKAGSSAAAERLDIGLSDVVLMDGGSGYAVDQVTGASVRLGCRTTVPNLVGLGLDAARSTLAAAGLKAGTVYELDNASGSRSFGVVLEQSHPAGGRVACDTAVNMALNLPPALALNPFPTLTNAASLSVSGTVEAGARVTVTAPAPALVGQISYPATGVWSCTIASLAEGENLLTVTATDDAFNRTSVSATIARDATAPSVSITAPQGLTATATPTFVYGASDGTVTLKLDGAIISKASGEVLDHLSDGQHFLRVEVVDGAGNLGFAEVSFTVDTLAPVLTVAPVTSPTSTPTQKISGTVDQGATVQVSASTAASVGTVTYPVSGAWECNLSSLVPGNNVITVTARDGAGNAAQQSVSISYLPVMAVAVAPATISADYQGEIALSILRLGTSGGEVLVEQLVDANRNGRSDGGDYVIRSFRVRDGAASENPVIPGDRDGAADGALSLTLPWYMAGDIGHAPGQFLFRVTHGTERGESLLIVTPVAYSQAIEGTVTDGGGPVAGALVSLSDRWMRPVAYTTADGDGQYRFDIPGAGDYLLMPLTGTGNHGALPSPVTLGPGQTISGQALAMAAGAIRLDGVVKDAVSTEGIGGVWVKAQGGNGAAYAVTRSDGAFTFLLPAGQYAVTTAPESGLPGPWTKGYLRTGGEGQAVNLSANTTGVELLLGRAEAYVTGTVRAIDGSPVVGMPVLGELSLATDPRGVVGVGITGADGSYVLGVSAQGSWALLTDSSAAQVRGLLTDVIPAFSPSGSPLSGNDLTARPATASLAGTVRNQEGLLLSGVEVRLRSPDSLVLARVRTASDGTYQLSAHAGSWFVDALTENLGYGGVPEQGVVLEDAQAATIDFAVDVTPPSLVINPVSTPTTSDSQIIGGSVENGASVVVTADTAARVGTVTYPSATTWSCTIAGLTEGANTLSVTATDPSGNQQLASTRIVYVKDPLPVGTIVINGGDPYAKSTTATLSLICVDGAGQCAQMQFSNDAVVWSTPVTFALKRTWTLTSANGLKTVYARFRDATGNWSSTVSAEITLDTLRPVTTATPAGGSHALSQTVTLTCGDGSGSGCAATYYTTDGTAPTTASSPYVEPLAISASATLKFFSVDRAGNSETVKLLNYTIDPLPPSGTAAINGGASLAKSTSVMLNLTCTDNSGSCAQAQFSNDGATWSTPATFAASRSWSLTSANGVKTVYARFKDAAGNWSETVSAGITLDTLRPVTSVTPAGGSYALPQTVTLTCGDGSGSGCAATYYTIDGTAPTTASSQYLEPLVFSASTTIKFFSVDRAGNSEAVKTLNYTIDPLPPSGTVAINSGASLAKSTSVTLNLTCADNSGSCAQAQFSNDGTTWSTPVTYAASRTWSFTSTNGVKTVYARFKDAAGNWSEAVSAEIALDTLRPVTTVTPAGGTYNRVQTVTLACGDGSGSGCAGTYYTTDGTVPSTSSARYTEPLTIAATMTLKFFSIDTAGNSELVKSQTYTIDPLPPSGTMAINSGSALAKSTTVTLNLACSDNSGSCAQMQFSNDGTTWSTPVTFAASRSWTLTSTNGVKTVYARFKDAAGNWSETVSAEIALDTLRPVTTVSPVGGTYYGAQTVTLSCGDGSGAGCAGTYYTTDGTVPTTASARYVEPLSIPVTTTLKFFSVDNAGNSEVVRSQGYLIK